MNAYSENARGVLFILVANVFLILSDTIAKLLTEQIAVSQLIVVRGAFGIVVALVFCAYFRVFPDAAAFRDRFFWLRIVSESAAMVAYLTALANMKITAVTAIIQAVPIAVTASASAFFGTKVSVARWIAVGAGFAGVLLIIRPAMDGFTPWSLVALIAVFCITLRDLSSRAMNNAIHPFAIALVSIASSLPTGFAMAQFEQAGWGELTSRELLFCMLSAVALPCGFAFAVKAMRHGEVAVVMAFRYSLLLFAIIAQLTVFATPLDLPTIAGALILVVSGIYTLWHK